MKRIGLLVAACGGRGWSVITPKQIEAVPLDSYVSFGVFTTTDGVKPGPIDTIVPRCADTKICETRMRDGQVDVIARQVGSTQILIDVIAPSYVPHDRITIPVAVTAAPNRPQLAVGQALPRAVASFEAAHCVALPRYYESVYGPAGLQVFTCGMADGDGKYQTCDGSVPCQLSFSVCAEARDHVVVGLRVIEAHRIARTEGTFQGRNCEPRL